MGITPTGRSENLKKSVDAWVNSQLVSVFGAANIDWEGVPFSDTGKKEWLQVRLLEVARPAIGFARRVSTTVDAIRRGHHVIVGINATVFVRPSLQGQDVRSFRVQALADSVRNAFTEHTKIAVLDYQGDDSSLGNLIVDRLVLDRQITDPQMSDDLRQWTIGAECRWLEKWTA